MQIYLKVFGPQFVAGQDQLQKDAQQLAITGIGGNINLSYKLQQHQQVLLLINNLCLHINKM
jgi:hypothetical protein